MQFALLLLLGNPTEYQAHQNISFKIVVLQRKIIQKYCSGALWDHQLFCRSFVSFLAWLLSVAVGLAWFLSCDCVFLSWLGLLFPFFAVAFFPCLMLFLFNSTGLEFQFPCSNILLRASRNFFYAVVCLNLVAIGL